MIIRKPYAFLIKNFKKIHIFLLLLSFYVAYKLLDVNAFVGDFMKFGTYDLFQDPIKNHISSFLMFCIFLLFLGSLSLLFLLYHKKKPWKIYLAPVIEYAALFFVLNMIKSFFRNFSSDVATTDLRMSRDLLFLFLIVQLPVIGIYVMRVFGLDIKKFNFNSDQEFLELSEEDREEIEIGFNIDKNSFIRFFKRVLRNMNYFYLEHTKICKFIIGVIILIVGFRIYKFAYVTNKSYEEGDYYSANGYTMKINKAYFTDKDYVGNVISDKSNFVIVNITITNHSAPRKIKLENLHLKNGTTDMTTTKQLYAQEFYDLGETYAAVKEVKRDETLNFIIVYQVDKDLSKDKFALYYQENSEILRKIKLKLKDIRKLEEPITIPFGEEMKINIESNPDTISFDQFGVKSEAEYLIRSCITTGCTIENRSLTADDTYKILQITFGSETYDSKNMIDFLSSYGKIIYKDSSGEEDILPIKSLVTRPYFSKTVFLKAPADLKDEDLLRMEFTVRNKRYVYNFS